MINFAFPFPKESARAVSGRKGEMDSDKYILLYMKIIATSDWHLGNMFHGNDRMSEHQHFLSWLLAQIEEQQPDALLVAGDIFDNGNPSAASQSAYYTFLADANERCPQMLTILTAGNHDSASRLEAPRELLSRHRVEVRGTIQRRWNNGRWICTYDDLIIPVEGTDGTEAVVLAVPFLRNDISLNGNYSAGVNKYLRELTAQARAEHPGKPLIMMAHMYAKGAMIAAHDASEKIIIGGQEEVAMEDWEEHPDYLTCGHIHRRQKIWGTEWARYTGSVLPMSFAEADYTHGIDLLTIADGAVTPALLEYTPSHPLHILPADGQELTPKEVARLVEKEIPNREEGKLSDHFEYVLLKVKLDKPQSEEIHHLETLFEKKDAVLCKIQKVLPHLGVTTLADNQTLKSIDEVLSRDPLDALKETFQAINKYEMSESQEQMLKQLIHSIDTESDDL